MDNWRFMLNELLADDSDKMSDWEIQFVESLDSQSDDFLWQPSAEQYAKLVEVWEKVFE